MFDDWEIPIISLALPNFHVNRDFKLLVCGFRFHSDHLANLEERALHSDAVDSKTSSLFVGRGSSEQKDLRFRILEGDTTAIIQNRESGCREVNIDFAPDSGRICSFEEVIHDIKV